jgi:ubiquinone/menaquinone biosynthesis C-methylase UbiE
MQRFFADFETGKRKGRYVAAALPHLPFPDASFDLALCSHLLFLYSDYLSLDAHVEAVRELLRVAREVCIFPLLTLSGERSAHLPLVYEALHRDGHGAEEQIVDYEFQRGGNVMLRLRRKTP